MVITGYQANHGNGKVTVATDRVFDTIDHGMTDMMYFFRTAKEPLVGIQGSVSYAVADATAIIDSTGWVGSDMDDIVDRFVNWNSTYSSTLKAIGADEMLDEVLGGLSESVDPIVDSVDELLGTLGTELVGVEDMIKETVGGAVDAIEAMNKTVADMGSQMDSFREASEATSEFRQAGVLALFVVAMVFVFLGFVGVLAAFTPWKFDDGLEFLLHFTWVFGSLIGTFAFIIGGVLFTFAISKWTATAFRQG